MRFKRPTASSLHAPKHPMNRYQVEGKGKGDKANRFFLVEAPNPKVAKEAVVQQYPGLKVKEVNQV